MRAYVIRRVLLVVPTLLILSMIVFLLVRFIPGDVIDAMQADFAFTAGEIDREALERKLGLDKPIPAQYARWLAWARSSDAECSRRPRLHGGLGNQPAVWQLRRGGERAHRPDVWVPRSENPL